MPAYEQYTFNNYNLKNKISYSISEYGISLPSSANLIEDDVDYICTTFMEILENAL
jgi:dTDP-4-amino-4,6-dideoxygalactose transaminase